MLYATRSDGVLDRVQVAEERNVLIVHEHRDLRGWRYIKFRGIIKGVEFTTPFIVIVVLRNAKLFNNFCNNT